MKSKARSIEPCDRGNSSSDVNDEEESHLTELFVSVYSHEHIQGYTARGGMHGCRTLLSHVKGPVEGVSKPVARQVLEIKNSMESYILWDLKSFTQMQGAWNT